MELFVVDRFEGEFAVLENINTKEIVNVAKSILPNEVKEGHILKFEDGIYVIDYEQTEIAKQRIKEKMNRLWKK